MANSIKLNLDDQNVVTGLDLGSRSIKCVMASVKDGQCETIAYTKANHEGIQNQRIVDTRMTAVSIRKVCQEIEIISERKITDLWIALGGAFQICSSEGMAIITGGQVTRKHILQAIATARAVPLADHQEVLHILPRYFKVDRKDPVFNPIGLSGLRLETLVSLVTCSVSDIQDLRSCLKEAARAGRGFVIQPLASSLSVVSQEDKSQGVCVIDIGHSSSQVSIFYKGRLAYMNQIPFGGGDITGEIVNQLKVSPEMAEQIKIQYGIPSKEDLISSSAFFSDNFSVDLKQLYDLTTDCLGNSFCLLKQELKSKSLMDVMYKGIILTGGGAQLKNLDHWFKNYFEKSCQVATLQGVSRPFSSHLEYGAALGLVQYALDDRLDFKEKPSKMMMKNWLKDLMP